MQTANFGIFSIYIAAFLLGAAHSLEPGHGKTVVAAYLVGSRGRSIDAVLLGLVVTFTHTFSIVLLGLLAKFSSRYFTDQELHGYLGIVASLIILVIGIWMLRSRWLALRDPAAAGHGHFHLFGSSHHGHSHHHHEHANGAHGHHDHDHDHDGHHHHPHDHDHQHDHQHHGQKSQQLGLTGLILLGISGGIIPCPAALAILLASASVGDIGKGLAMVLIFSAGLAICLVGIGLAVVNGARLTSRFFDTERYAPYVAFTSAVIVTLVGAATFYSSMSHFRAL